MTVPNSRNEEADPNFPDDNPSDFVSLKDVLLFLRNYLGLFIICGMIGLVIGWKSGKKKDVYNSRALLGRSQASLFFIKEEAKIQKTIRELFKDSDVANYFATQMAKNFKKQEMTSENKEEVMPSLAAFMPSPTKLLHGEEVLLSPDENYEAFIKIFSRYLMEDLEPEGLSSRRFPRFRFQAENELYELSFSSPQPGGSLLFLKVSIQSLNEVISFFNKKELSRIVQEKKEKKEQLMSELLLQQEKYTTILSELQTEHSRLAVDFYRLMNQVSNIEKETNSQPLLFEKNRLHKFPELVTESYIDALEKRDVLKRLADLTERGRLSTGNLNKLLQEFNKIMDMKSRYYERHAVLMAPYSFMQKQAAARAEEEVAQIDLSTFSLPLIDVPTYEQNGQNLFPSLGELVSKKRLMSLSGFFIGFLSAFCLVLGLMFFRNIASYKIRKIG